MKYEIDQLKNNYNRLSNDYSYIVIVKLPYCAVPGPFRIVAKTAKQARAWKHRKSITNIKMWHHNPLREKKKKVSKIKPNPISWQEFPKLLEFWSLTFINSIIRH